MITILGKNGFVGSNLVNFLKELCVPYYAPEREEDLSNKRLGHIVYCIGLTADFRSRPFDTVQAHVCVLNKILERFDFESLTYLSSTRVYINSKENEVFEDTPISIFINNPDELYTLTKLTGERICLSSKRNARVVRISNVYGNDYTSENFITDVIRKVKNNKFVELYTTLTSSKDYISIDSLCKILFQIAENGTQPVYNVANGSNFSNFELVSLLKEYYDFDYKISESSREIVFPKINIDKISQEFAYKPDNTRDKLFNLLKNL